MKYTGDTPAKKVTRLIVWKRIKELLGAQFFLDDHLVLLSQEAGDVSTLLGLGVALNHIRGVDSDKHAVAAASKKFPGGSFHLDSVVECAADLKALRVKLVSAYFDFCGPMRDSTVDTVLKASFSLADKAAVAITFKLGREKGDWADKVNAKTENAPGTAAFHSRVDILTEELLARGSKATRTILPTDFYRYSSHRTTGEASEMLVCIGRLHDGKIENPKQLAKQLVSKANYATITADDRFIGPLASLLRSREERADLLLNLPSTSMPAYLAHRTRGTYDGRSTKIQIRKGRR